MTRAFSKGLMVGSRERHRSYKSTKDEKSGEVRRGNIAAFDWAKKKICWKMAMAFVSSMVARPYSISLLTRQRPKWTFTPLALCFSSSSTPSASPSKARTLVLYSKPGCCLCDGLKEKLQAAFLISGPDSLHDVDLQVRDITTNPEWERAYRYEIPVLAKQFPDGTEEVLPRISPRLGVELVQKKIAAALTQ